MGEGWERPEAEREMLPQIAGRMKGQVGFEDGKMSVRQLAKLADAISDAVLAAKLAPAGDLVEQLRAVKDAGELKAIEAAAELADDVYRWAIEQGMAGRTELDVARAAVARIRELGAEPSFPPIVAAGPNGALPHAEPGEREIGKGELVVFDMGAELGRLLLGLHPHVRDRTRSMARRARSTSSSARPRRPRSGPSARGWAARRSTASRASRSPPPATGATTATAWATASASRSTRARGSRRAPTTSCARATSSRSSPASTCPGPSGVRIEDLVVVEADGPRILSGLPKELTTAIDSGSAQPAG